MILIAGATGYVGRCVLKILSEKKTPIRCFVRKPTLQKLVDLGIVKNEKKNVSYFTGDAMDYNSLLLATKDIAVVYYFIHHMDSSNPREAEKFDKLDRTAAENIVKACRENKVKRIIYLGGICNPEEKLSLHLRSRKEVENIISGSGIDYTIFRAPFIIGRGAAAFEIFDNIVKKFPIISFFNWGQIKSQPIYYKDAVKYLVDCLGKKKTINKSFDIGGKDVLSHEEFIRQYAESLGLKRYFISAPEESRWFLVKILTIVTSINSNIIYWLVESLTNNAIANPEHEKELKKIFGFEPLGFRESVEKVLNEV